MDSPTRDQVRTAIWTNVGSCRDSSLDAAADAVMALLAEAPQPRVLPSHIERDDLLSVLAGLADGGRPGHNACESCADVMRRAREMLLPLYDATEEAPQPRVLWRGETTARSDGSVVSKVNRFLMVPPGTRVVVIADEETPAPKCDCYARAEEPSEFCPVHGDPAAAALAAAEAETLDNAHDTEGDERPHPPVPSWVDEHLPPRGRCGLCGGPDARHRLLDAIAGRVRAGDSPEGEAEDYGLPVEFVARIVAEWDTEERSDG